MAGAGVLSAFGYVSPDHDPTYLADHPIVIVIPFVLPVLLVVAMVAVVAIRDRRRGDEEDGSDVGSNGEGRNEQASAADAADPGARRAEGEHG
jgi:hypothetical protein